jgi:hypothetical protein
MMKLSLCIVFIIVISLLEIEAQLQPDIEGNLLPPVWIKPQSLQDFISLPDTFCDAATTSISPSGRGKAIIVWTQQSNTFPYSMQVYYKLFNETTRTWQPNPLDPNSYLNSNTFQPNNYTSNADSPKTVIDKLGNIFVVWAQNVYMNTQYGIITTRLLMASVFTNSKIKSTLYIPI